MKSYIPCYMMSKKILEDENLEGQDIRILSFVIGQEVLSEVSDGDVFERFGYTLSVQESLRKLKYLEYIREEAIDEDSFSEMTPEEKELEKEYKRSLGMKVD